MIIRCFVALSYTGAIGLNDLKQTPLQNKIIYSKKVKDFPRSFDLRGVLRSTLPIDLIMG